MIRHARRFRRLLLSHESNAGSAVRPRGRALARTAANCYETRVDGRRFRKGAALPNDITGFVRDDLGIGSSKGRIRCPECRWEPRKSDRWQCVCSHLWHAFETRGRCPECSSRWHVMQCLRCEAWSAHDAWYS